MRPATKPNGFEYYEYMLVYVDDILVASHDPKPVMEGIKLRFELKGDKYGEPTDFLGAQLKKRIMTQNPDNLLSAGQCLHKRMSMLLSRTLRRG